MKKYNYIALIICALSCVIWSYILDLKYYRLGYYSWDLALYSNLMWNLCHGSMKTSLFGANFLIDHFNAVALFLVPIYWIFQSALMLIYFKLFALFIGAYVLYLITAKRVGGAWGITLMLAYMFCPANISLIFFEFNFENLALPLILMMFYFFEEEKFLPFIICSALMCLVKENMPLVVMMFGFYALFVRIGKWAYAPFILGISSFILEVFVIIPHYNQGFKPFSGYWHFYPKLGNTPLIILESFVFHPFLILKLLFTKHNIIFMSKLFGPMLIFSILSPQILLIAAPLFIQNLLSNFSGQQSVAFFYSATMTTFIFIATIESLGKINERYRGLVLAFLILFMFIGDVRNIPQWKYKIPSFNKSQAETQYILSKIPKEASVASSYKFLYLLSEREEIYPLISRNVFTYQKNIIPNSVNYIAIDRKAKTDNIEAIRGLVDSEKWFQIGISDNILLLKRGGL